MAVLEQTSATAEPGAPEAKPSSTVPSASTNSAVGLGSGQAGNRSVCVMSALPSVSWGQRQKRISSCAHDTRRAADFDTLLLAREPSLLIDACRSSRRQPWPNL